MRLVIECGGNVRCLYSETIPLQLLGSLHIQRASQVEPDEAGNWWADLSRSSGPRLGPFSLRSQALLAERDWLETHWLPTQQPRP